MNNQEAIKSLHNIVEYWSCRPTEQEAAKMAISALQKQQTDAWIPVTDGKVDTIDTNELYEVSIRYENFAGVYEIVRTAYYDGEKWIIYGPQPMILNRTITAYRKPTPYKEEANAERN